MIHSSSFLSISLKINIHPAFSASIIIILKLLPPANIFLTSTVNKINSTPVVRHDFLNPYIIISSCFDLVFHHLYFRLALLRFFFLPSTPLFSPARLWVYCLVCPRCITYFAAMFLISVNSFLTDGPAGHHVHDHRPYVYYFATMLLVNTICGVLVEAWAVYTQPF